VDCLTLAQQAGNAKAVNLVLLGRLSHYFDFAESAWQEAIEACVPAKFLDVNKRAFALGQQA
ncbi:MAG: indolepyruvate oxidoreductase subunit beta, partial [Acutalibacter sp.]|nr:indolepyruvate oxidoreductase subunit beta [Acutalibacter sp.]